MIVCICCGNPFGQDPEFNVPVTWREEHIIIQSSSSPRLSPASSLAPTSPRRLPSSPVAVVHQHPGPSHVVEVAVPRHHHVPQVVIETGSTESASVGTLDLTRIQEVELPPTGIRVTRTTSDPGGWMLPVRKSPEASDERTRVGVVDTVSESGVVNMDVGFSTYTAV